MTRKPVLGNIDPDKLNKYEKKEELSAKNIIKEIIYGRIKGHTCKIGSKQRRYLKDEETLD